MDNKQKNFDYVTASVTNLIGDDGVIYATATVVERRLITIIDNVVGAAECKLFLEQMRAMPTETHIVSIHYPKLKAHVVLNNPNGVTHHMKAVHD